MHQIHHTEGIILGSRNFGEASKYYSILTKDLGMIYASASGVRKMSSKLRYILQDFSYMKVDLVKGKDFWRVTSASKISGLESLRKEPQTFEVLANIARLLRKLLAGEYPNESLFRDVVEGLTILEKTNGEEEVRSIEAIMVLRILGNLGYIGGKKFDGLVKSPFEKELVLEAAKNRREILNQINKALKQTHL